MLHRASGSEIICPADIVPVGDLDNMAVELDESEAKVEELKAQLDAASEAQDMLEELTDRNMQLQDVGHLLDRSSLDDGAYAERS